MPVEHAHTEERRNVRPGQENCCNERESYHGNAVLLCRACYRGVEQVVFSAYDIGLLAHDIGLLAHDIEELWE